MTRATDMILTGRHEREFLREKKRVVAKLRMLRMFGDTSKAAANSRVERCRGKANLIEFGRTYLPHYFTTKTQALWHQDFIDTFEVTETPVTVIAPRGNAKSAIGSLADVLHDIVFAKEPFIVLAMETLAKATMQTWRILLELKYNQLIINDFGLLVDDETSRGDFATLSTQEHPEQTRVVALGGGMSARGLVFGPHRPTKFICDDLESKKVARNPEQVDKYVDLILSDYLYSLAAQGWKFRYVGTMIARGSVLDKLRKVPDMIHKHYKAIENLGTPQEYATWEEHEPLALLKRGMTRGISQFMSEKQGEPMENEGFIREEWLVHWRDLPVDLDRSKTVIVIDPSFSATGDTKAMIVVNPYALESKSKAFGVWSYNSLNEKGVLFGEGPYDIILAIYCRRASTIEFIKSIYQFQREFQATKVYIEGVFAQKIFFQNEYRRFRLNPEYGTLPLKYFSPPAVPKETRIAELQAPFQQGEIPLPPRDADNSDQETFIIQLVRHGQPGIKDDGPDVTASARHILHGKQSGVKRKLRLGR